MAFQANNAWQIVMLVYCFTLLAMSSMTAAGSGKSRHNSLVTASVRPKRVVFYPGGSVSVRCKARGGIRPEDYPFIGFFRQWNRTKNFTSTVVFPVTSRYPGAYTVAQAPSSSSSKVKRGRVVKVLTLGPEAYDTLSEGDNYFHCRATTYSGKYTEAPFVVLKKTDW